MDCSDLRQVQRTEPHFEDEVSKHSDHRAGRVLAPRTDAFGLRVDTLLLVQMPLFSELE